MTSKHHPETTRLRVLEDREARGDGEFVVYWMTAARRLQSNYALDRAIEIAREHRKPLIVLEALRVGYPWASRRFHAFVLQGMADNARRARDRAILYRPYVEPEPGAGSGLLRALSRRAVAMVTDDVPFFFYPRMLAAAARQVECRLEAVDSNGLLPVAAGGKLHLTAYAFRRHLQKKLKPHLLHPPAADPLARLRLPRLENLPEEVSKRWPAPDDELLAASPSALARLPIDDEVGPVQSTPGGSGAAHARLASFLDDRLARYADERNHPDAGATSGLSPYLHFGHLSPHEVLAALAESEGWDAETLPETGNGGREGWWDMSGPAEAFLDELVTWREVGLNFCHQRPDDYDRYESLPEWARTSLEGHASDPRPALYDLARLTSAGTDDEIWNAAQRELRAEGRIHNYLRMVWGKRVLEWTAGPREALAALVELNDRWALDGRDANSTSGIFWCLGRYDRPWGPEREIFGVVRYMSSANTRRKLRLADYLRQYSAQTSMES